MITIAMPDSLRQRRCDPKPRVDAQRRTLGMAQSINVVRQRRSSIVVLETVRSAGTLSAYVVPETVTWGALLRGDPRL